MCVTLTLHVQTTMLKQKSSVKPSDESFHIVCEQMSFVRVGRPQQHTKGKRAVRPKKAAAPKREWVVSTDICSPVKKYED